METVTALIDGKKSLVIRIESSIEISESSITNCKDEFYKHWTDRIRV